MRERDIPTDIRGLQDAYARGLDPAEVVDRVFAAIEAAGDPGIFISLVDRRAARRAAQKLGRFEAAAKPLWGIPFAVKDNIDAAGLPTTAGCPDVCLYAQGAAPRRWSRLLAAGAILIGKTNLDQFATGLVGVRTPYPVPKNAFDPAIVPGGSSSGSAVAVARGLVPFALGTDTAGSGRVPAGLNNIVGLKPSRGRRLQQGRGAGLQHARLRVGLRRYRRRRLGRLRGHRRRGRGRSVLAADRARAPGRGAAAPGPRHSTPGDQKFFGDAAAKAAWRAGVKVLKDLGAELVEIDMAPFNEAAALLYEGPWVAERYAAIGPFLAKHAREVHPVTRRIIDKAEAVLGCRRLRRPLSPGGAETRHRAGMAPHRCAGRADCAVHADSRGGGGRSDRPQLAARHLHQLRQPARPRRDRGARPSRKRPPRRRHHAASARAGRDAALASLARALPCRCRDDDRRHRGGPCRRSSRCRRRAGRHARAGRGRRAPLRPAAQPRAASLGAAFLRAVEHRAVRTGSTRCPAARRSAGLRARRGRCRRAIAVEVWALPAEAFGGFVAGIPPPLGIGTLLLADGTRPQGLPLRGRSRPRGARDISAFGGWRAYLASKG